MINKQRDEVISLTDVNRAAILIVQGITMIDAEPNSHGQLAFTFDNTDDKAKLASAAILHNTPLPIRDFLDAVRQCRELVYQHRLVSGVMTKGGPFDELRTRNYTRAVSCAHSRTTERGSSGKTGERPSTGGTNF